MICCFPIDQAETYAMRKNKICIILWYLKFEFQTVNWGVDIRISWSFIYRDTFYLRRLFSALTIAALIIPAIMDRVCLTKYHKSIMKTYVFQDWTYCGANMKFNIELNARLRWRLTSKLKKSYDMKKKFARRYGSSTEPSPFFRNARFSYHIRIAIFLKCPIFPIWFWKTRKGTENWIIRFLGISKFCANAITWQNHLSHAFWGISCYPPYRI